MKKTAPLFIKTYIIYFQKIRKYIKNTSVFSMLE